MDAFLKLDIFRKLPRDLTEPTFCGGLGKYFIKEFDNIFVLIVSTLCTVVLIVLGVHEVRTYISAQTSTQVYI